LSRLVDIAAARIHSGSQPNTKTDTDTDSQMLNRPTFPSGHTSGMQASQPLLSHSGDGQSSSSNHTGGGRSFNPEHSGDGQSKQRRLGTPFIPIYSGDGQGKTKGWSGDGRGNDAMPVWSEESRHQEANPLMPAYGRTPTGISVSSHTKPTAVNAPGSSVHVPLSDELSMKVNVANRSEKKARTKTKSGKNRDTWKLVALVFVFLVWVSTASTLLFLYMDRYLFP